MSTRQKGLALVLVLWVLVLMTVMAASFSLSMRRETNLIHNTQGHAQAVALAEAGINYAIMMSFLSEQQRWRGDGTPYQMTIAGATVRVKIRDEKAKVDINSADEVLLRVLATSAGLNEEESSEIVDAILDWRDADDARHLNGAEEAEYKDENKPYSPRNKPFQSVEELQMVLGVNPEIFTKLEPLVTVFSKEPGFDPRNASKELLMALPDVEPETVDDYLELRAESTENKTEAPPFPVPSGIKTVRGNGSIMSIESEVDLPGRGAAKIIATIKRQKGQTELPFNILSWKNAMQSAPPTEAETEQAEQ